MPKQIGKTGKPAKMKQAKATKGDIKKQVEAQAQESLRSLGIESLVESLNDTRRLVWVNFLIGTMRGLGFVLGTMIVIVLLVWLFKTLGGMPLIGDYVLQLVDFVRENADFSSIPSSPNLDVLSQIKTPEIPPKLVETLSGHTVISS